MATYIEIDAHRYQFLRDEDHWIDDGDMWSRLGELTHKDFDDFVDKQMVRCGVQPLTLSVPTEPHIIDIVNSSM